MVGQIAIPEKTNEITAIPRLLEILDITGSVVTIDAIGTTETVMKIIQEQGGYFVMQVKKNCPAVYQELKDTFSSLEKEKMRTGKNFQKKTKIHMMNTVPLKKTGRDMNTEKWKVTEMRKASKKYGMTSQMWKASGSVTRYGSQKKQIRMGMTSRRTWRPFCSLGAGNARNRLRGIR